MRARIAIDYAGVNVSLREVLLGNKPPEMLQASPKATVPVLVLENGTVIDESLDIIHWALAIADPDGWLSKLDEQQLSRANKMIVKNDNEFKNHLDHYKYADRFPELAIADTRAKAEDFLQKLEHCLQQQAYLVSEQLSFVDIAIFPFIRQFAHVDMPWFEQTAYTNLKRWLQGLLESPHFISAMKKYAVWQQADTELYFP